MSNESIVVNATWHCTLSDVSCELHSHFTILGLLYSHRKGNDTFKRNRVNEFHARLTKSLSSILWSWWDVLMVVLIPLSFPFATDHVWIYLINQKTATKYVLIFSTIFCCCIQYCSYRLRSYQSNQEISCINLVTFTYTQSL